jgi:hypothetical protein
METNTLVMLFAVVAALGLVTVVAVDVILLLTTTQEADAKCRPGGTGFNASKGRCV